MPIVHRLGGPIHARHHRLTFSCVTISLGAFRGHRKIAQTGRAKDSKIEILLHATTSLLLTVYLLFDVASCFDSKMQSAGIDEGFVTSLTNRVVLHIDMDAFYAQVDCPHAPPEPAHA